MDDGRTPDHGYTISSPCEPNGSGELKIYDSIFWDIYFQNPDVIKAMSLLIGQSTPHLYNMVCYNINFNITLISAGSQSVIWTDFSIKVKNYTFYSAQIG